MQHATLLTISRDPALKDTNRPVQAALRRPKPAVIISRWGGGGQACASFLHMTPRSQHQSPGHMEATKSVGTGLSQPPAIYPHPEGRSQLLKHLHLGTPMPPPPPPENDFGLSLHKCKQNHKPSFKTGFPGLISSKNSNFFVNQAFK